MKKSLSFIFIFLAFLSNATQVPISVDLTLDEIDYVCGERIRGVIDVKNMSADEIRVGGKNGKDRLFIEVYRAGDMLELERTSTLPFVASFDLKMNEGQKLETFLADHFALATERRYLARPVLVHGKKRYEGQYRAFDVVPGMKMASALQLFANNENLRRRFELVRWMRRDTEHLFLTACDEGSSTRKWLTTDVGALMKITKPSISILPSGEIIVIHRTGPDHFIRSEFWSLPNALEFHSRELIQDPDTAGQNRVKEMYQKSGGVKAVERPWWKFW